MAGGGEESDCDPGFAEEVEKGTGKQDDSMLMVAMATCITNVNRVVPVYGEVSTPFTHCHVVVPWVQIFKQTSVQFC